MSMTDVEVLRAACCVAGLDGEIDAEERKMLGRLADRAGVGEASLNAMMDLAKNDHTFYKKQFRILHSEPHMTIRTLYLVAAADGHVDQEEKMVLRLFGRRLGLTDEQFDQVIEQTRAQIRDRQAGRKPAPDIVDDNP